MNLRIPGFRHNTTIMILGDHGARGGYFRQTEQGKLEERLPFMSISLPPWFKKKYSSEMMNLRRNSEILTSWFDMYQTLRHIMWPANFTVNRPTGRSLFTDVVSLNRTCDESGIPSHYCVCLVSSKVKNDDKTVSRVASFVVSHINKMVQNIAIASKLCAPVQLDRVTQAHMLGSNKELMNHKGWTPANFVTYSVQMKMKNFGAMFEATEDVWDKHMKLSGDISRINRYGDQPKCVAQQFPELRKFCFCKDFKPS